MSTNHSNFSNSCLHPEAEAALHATLDTVNVEVDALLEQKRELVEALESLCERLETFQNTLTIEGDRAWVLGEVRCARAALSRARTP